MTCTRRNRPKREQAFFAACAALRSAYRHALAHPLDKNLKQQFARRLDKVFTAAERGSFDLADICEQVIGTRDLITCLTHIKQMGEIEDRVATVDPIVVDLPMMVIDNRERIRETRAYEATTGPPPLATSESLNEAWRAMRAALFLYLKAARRSTKRPQDSAKPARRAARKRDALLLIPLSATPPQGGRPRRLPPAFRGGVNDERRA